MNLNAATNKFLAIALFLVSIVLVVVFIGNTKRLNTELRQSFEGKRWSLPAVVYARPLDIYPGLKLSADMFERELQLAGYRLENPVMSPGGYNRQESIFQVITRNFAFPSGYEKSTNMTISFDNGRISQLVDNNSSEAIVFLQLDPPRIGSFHPLVNEDRIVITASEIPDLLGNTLVAVEDQNFYSHHGLSPIGIVRSLMANIKAGKVVQGGSTITQQLVKNFFLDRSRTISRKVQEAVMALLMEHNYSKDEILTAYINEVFMGQDGNRAVHGFALASQFYFRRDLKDLSVAQVATLVGMVKGPSFYDLRRHPERCLARRDVVLQLMVEAGVIDGETFAKARAQTLTDVRPQKNGFNRFPAFLELVKRQLKTDYKEDDLTTDGLKIFTTLDPQIQLQSEASFSQAIKKLEKQVQQEQIEGAVVLSGRESGEVQAIIGGRRSVASDFNRALDAKRQIGSLIKPAVYLTALDQGYTLASPVNDSALSIETSESKWQPQNYDKREHGRVALYTALAQSYNLATVRLGLDVGLENVISTIKRLGHSTTLEPYPSLLLGATAMSPVEVTQIYQTIATGGFFMPLRSIRSVMAADNSILSRYELEVEQRFSPQSIFLLTHALKRVLTEGTGRNSFIGDGSSYAGKTGTSDDLRDSWFAGFSAETLAVVWLGRDDNKTTALTGATGALSVWARIMADIDRSSLEQAQPADISWARIDTETLEPTSSFNTQSTVLPFLEGTTPDKTWQLPEFDLKTIEKGARDFFESLNKLIN